MSYDEMLAHIFARGRFGMKPGLERIEVILERLGNPHRELGTIQVAGTNGKGSTGAFLSSILSSAGYKSAFFSSPHLSRFSERFRINDTEVSADLLHGVMQRVLAAAPDDGTFFEIVTAIAFLLFAEQNVDIAIMEAGMGGRWDATNITTPLLSIITPISLDHCQYLGGTLQLIAAEKAGIIKPGIPVIVAPQEQEALGAIMAAAQGTGSRVYLYGRDFSMDRESSGLEYISEAYSLHGIQLSLRGGYQTVNAASAITAARVLNIPEESILKGVATAVWPGRLELFESTPPILLDGAHNPAGALSLKESLSDFSYGKLLLVAGVMSDKDWQSVMAPLLAVADRVIAVEPAIERALSADELAAFCKQRGVDSLSAGSVSRGIEMARDLAGEKDLVLVTGSLFTVGEARAYLTGGSFMPIRG